MHTLDGSLFGKPFGNRLCIAAVTLHAQLERFEALQENPGIEGAHGRPRRPQHPVDRLANVLAVADDRTTDTAALAVEVLGSGVDDDVGTEIQRPLESRRAKAVIDDQQCIVRMRETGKRADIAELCQGIRWRLQKEQPGIGLHRLFPGCGVIEIDEGRLDAETRQVVRKEDCRGAEKTARADDMVAFLEQPEADCKDRGHTGGCGDTGLPAFHRGKPLLETAHRGIRETGIDVAGLFAGETRCRFGCGAEDKARGRENGLRVLSLGRRLVAGPDRRRGGAPLLFIVHCLYPESARSVR